MVDGVKAEGSAGGEVGAAEPRRGRLSRGCRAGRRGVAAAALLAVALAWPGAPATEGRALEPAAGAAGEQVGLPPGCRLPSDDQLEAGGALEGIMLALHGLVYEPVPLEHGVAFGDPGPCPGGSLDAFRGVDIMGWALEVSGPAQPNICSPEDPPITELPLRSTRCVEPSTTVASRNARVPFGELRTRAPFPLLLPTTLPDGLTPHWTTFRVTDRRAESGVPRQYGTVLRFRGEAESPWLLLLEDTGTLGDWMLATLRANAPMVEVRGTRAAVLDHLPEYDGPGRGLLWEERGLRVVLFGTYSVPELVDIAAGLAVQAPQGSTGRRVPQSVAAS